MSVFFLCVQCDEPLPVNDYGEQLIPPPTSDLSQITQIADTVNGNQGDSTEFLLSDYFESEAPINFTQFESPVITIQEKENETYLLTQSDTLSGEFIISGMLVNEDSDTLETELVYNIIAKEDSTSDGGSGDSGDGDDEETGGDDEGSGDDDGGGDEGSGDDEDDSGDPSDSTANRSELVIMPLGDSITNDGRSRIKLWHLLVDDGYSLDYVGDQVQRNSLPDHDHEGVGGITIQGVTDKAASLMQRHKPEFVYLMIGTNDIAWYFDETGEEIAERWDDLVQLIFDNLDPDSFIIAATIPPVTSKDNGKDGMPEKDRAVIVKDYNEALRERIEDRKAAGDNIILADVEAALSLKDHVSGDGVHLNAEGYSVMGTMYYEAIKSILED
ncbi:MAG: GDSL-type esterase/lipase family protein [Balneolaceae bacterium]